MTANKHEERLEQIPAYAIGALDDDERVAFEAWLRDDPEAQALLAEYQAVAQHLVALAPLRSAPDHLQADLRQRLAAAPRAQTPDTLPLGKPTMFPVRRSRAAAWILAAAAVLTVVIVGVILALRGSDDAPSVPIDAVALYDELVQQAGSSQFSVVAGDVVDTVAGDLVVSADGSQAVLRVSALPAITSDQIFQMWLVDSEGMRTSGGLFQADSPEATVYLQVPFSQTATNYQGVGVSLEPAGGSPFTDRPTGPRVLSVPLG